jgi:hypothetical protein
MTFYSHGKKTKPTTETDLSLEETDDEIQRLAQLFNPKQHAKHRFTAHKADAPTENAAEIARYLSMEGGGRAA